MHIMVVLREISCTSYVHIQEEMNGCQGISLERMFCRVSLGIFTKVRLQLNVS